MSITRLNDSVIGPNGETTTINELDKKRLIKYKKWHGFGFRNPRTAYFAVFRGFDITSDLTKGFEISEMDYLSKKVK